MKGLNRWWRRGRMLLGRARVEREMDEEMRFHLEMETEELMRRGLEPEAARREALRAFGGVERYKEEGRDARGVRPIEDLAQDVRYGLRSLRRSPAFTICAVLTLALGIGGTTAIFGLVDTVLLRPLPYPEPDRLVMIWEHNFKRDRLRNVISPANFLDWQGRSGVFEQMAMSGTSILNLTDGGEPEELSGQRASARYFSVLGVPPLLGRVYTEAEDVPGAGAVIVLGHGLWQRRFGGDPDIVGQKLTLNGQPTTVVGVMPAGFGPDPDAAQFWAPLRLDPAVDYRAKAGRFLTAMGRLKPGISLAQAQAELSELARRLEQEHVDFNTGWGVNLVPLHEQVVGEVRPVLLLLLGAVGFVLLIACANVASLFLARTAGRRREIALRRALGASGPRLTQQLMTESLLLWGAGGVLGVLLAVWVLRLLPWLAGDWLPRGLDFSLEPRMLGFTAAVALVTGLLFGSVPAMAAVRADLRGALGEGGRGGSAGQSQVRARKVLVVAEVALALVLLAGAGLLMGSFTRLMQVQPGFETDKVLTARVALPRERYAEGAQQTAFFRQLAERVRALPGVIECSAISFLPLTGMAAATSFTIEGQPAPEAGEKPVTDVRVVLPGYFQAMGIPLLAGRSVTEQDFAGQKRVAVISEVLAQRHFPGQDPLGQRLVLKWGQAPAADEIVGVVGDVKHYGLDSEVRPMVYWPQSQSPMPFMSLVVKTAVDPAGLAPSVRGEIRALDAQQPIPEMRTLDELLADSVLRRRSSMVLLAVFAAVALALASIGIYGLIAHGVAQRTREIGIRMALGAQRGAVLRMVTGQGLRLAVAGVGLGLVAAWGVTRWMAGLLFDIRPTDPATFAAVSFLLLGVAAVASWIPARRAARIDPTTALRHE